MVRTAYITSKAAVMHMAKSLAAFLIDYRIRVNVIAPGGQLLLFRMGMEIAN